MVYIDNYNAPYRGMVMCHMWADSEAELHAMADKIGVARKWAQRGHYDVCLAKKALAVKAGAIAVTVKEGARLRVAAKRLARLEVKPDGATWGDE